MSPARLGVVLTATAIVSFAASTAHAAAGACEEAPCASDGDCGPGTRCVAGAGPACDAGDGSTCGLCTVRWQAPCSTAADCGDGFLCTLPPSTLDGATPDDASVSTGVCTIESVAQSGGGAARIADAGAPDGWTCALGTCEPPCTGAGASGEPPASAPPSSDTVSPGDMPGHAAGCGCRVVHGSVSRDGWALALGLLAALGSKRRRDAR